MDELITLALVPILTRAGTLAFIFAISAKGINILIKAATRGEVVV